MNRQTADQTLQGALRQGEQVLWDGTSAQFPLLAGDSRNQILGKWIGTAAGTAVVLALYMGNAVYYMELGEIDEIRTVSDKTEYDCLAVGSAVFEDIKSQMRWRSCHPKMDAQGGVSSGEALGLILFNLRDCQGAEMLLGEVRKSAGREAEMERAMGA